MRIVYFDIDSLRADHLGCYGYARPTSPNIDRIAGEGMRFDRTYVSDSPCMPSRTSFVTGRFGFSHGIVTHGQRHNQPNIPQQRYGGPLPDYQLLQIKLRQAGMDTFGFSTFPVRHTNAIFSLGWTGMFTPSLETGNEPAEEVCDAVLDWVARNNDRDDYFLYVNCWDPHRIYKEAQQEWFDQMAQHPAPFDWPDDEATARHCQYTGPFTAGTQFPDNKTQTRLMPGRVASHADYEHMINGYDAMIAYTDQQIGRVIDELERQNGLDDTAIIISADHGDAFGEHGIYSDHVCAHEPVHRVPMIVRWPGVTSPGTSSDHLLYHVDLTATLCDLVAGEVPSGYDGESFASLLRGEAQERRSHLVWGHGLYTLQRAVRTDTHLFLKTTYHHCYSQFEPYELYDMQRDPWMQQNIAADAPGMVGDLHGRLESWRHQQANKPHANGDPMETVRRTRESLGVFL